MEKLLKLIFARYPLVLLLLGVIIFLIAASGKLPLYFTTVEITETAWRITVAILGLILLGISIYLMLNRPSLTWKVAHDVFLAYPMAALEPKSNYDRGRAHALNLAEALKTYSDVSSVYFAGQKIGSPQDFETHEIAAEVDLAAIDQARYFVMVLPDKLVSSVLFEAGYALARGKPSVYFVRDKKHLPYLMRNVDALPQNQFPRTRIEIYEDDDELLRVVKANKSRLFPNGKADI